MAGWPKRLSKPTLRSQADLDSRDAPLPDPERGRKAGLSPVLAEFLQAFGPEAVVDAEGVGPDLLAFLENLGVGDPRLVTQGALWHGVPMPQRVIRVGSIVALRHQTSALPPRRGRG